jgi:hypothetical protein
VAAVHFASSECPLRYNTRVGTAPPCHRASGSLHAGQRCDSARCIGAGPPGKLTRSVDDCPARVVKVIGRTTAALRDVSVLRNSAQADFAYKPGSNYRVANRSGLLVLMVPTTV